MAETALGNADSGDERLRKTPLIRKLMNRPELGAVAGAILVFLFFAIFAGGSGMFGARAWSAYWRSPPSSASWQLPCRC